MLWELFVVVALSALPQGEPAERVALPTNESPLALAEDAEPESLAAREANWLNAVEATAPHQVGPEYSWVGPEWWWNTSPPPRQRWRASLDMVILTRTNSNDLEIFREPGAGDELLNADDMSFNPEIGPRFQFLAPVGDNWTLQFSIFGVDGFRTQAVYAGPLELRLPGTAEGGTFAMATSPLVDYRSTLGSQELNLRRRLNSRVTVLAGFRSIQLEETFSAASFLTRIYDVTTDNRLYGGQLGLDLQLAARRRFELMAFARAGIYRNDALAETNDSSSLFALAPENRQLRAVSGDVAFAGEAGLLGSIRFWDFVILRGGYQVMHVEGIALAPEQLPFNDFATPTNPLVSASGIDDSGQVFFHGAVAGLEVRW